MRQLNAWIEKRKAGTFSETPLADGTFEYAFEYDGASEQNIVSLTMVPTEDELRFESRVFPPPFDMILPEGERRAKIEEARKILRTDSFSLLSYVGANPVNRVQFLEPGQIPSESPPEIPTPPEIAQTRNGQEVFRALLERIDLRQGVAGVQPKVLGTANLQKVSAELRQFRGSTHLLKASTTRYPFLAANEHLCLSTFARAGVEVPKNTLSADGELLLVERFDIRADGSFAGFEEAAALMGETSATKYLRDYGTMMNVMCDFVPPQEQRNAREVLSKCILLNHLLGNGDAHLKNFGVLFEDSQNVRIAPAYDCVTTLAYTPDDVPALALSFEWYSKAWWPRQKLEEFLTMYGSLSHAQARKIIEECCDATLRGAEEVVKLGKEVPGFKMLSQKIAEIWNNRVRNFLDEPGIPKRRRNY